jgi:hypothetical protein
MEWIYKVVDSALEKMAKTTISMMTPAKLPVNMVDESIPKSDDWTGWKPTESIITDEDLTRLENKIGHNLPLSFREFLKYKHFVQLRLNNYAIGLFSHMPDKELSELKRKILEFHEPELLIDQGYIYFADFNDYGLLCFDTNNKRENFDWSVVYIDHDDLETIHEYAENFKDLIESDEEHGNRFIDKLNKMYQ